MNPLVSVDIEGLLATIDAKEQDVYRAARPAAQAGSEVLYRAVQRNVAGLGHVTGKLAAAIYQAHSEQHSGPGHHTYHVSWNARTAPHGHLLENGYIQKYRVFFGKDGKWHTDKRHPLPQPKQVAARSFVRRAQSAFKEAQDAMEARFLKELGHDS